MLGCFYKSYKLSVWFVLIFIVIFEGIATYTHTHTHTHTHTLAKRVEHSFLLKRYYEKKRSSIIKVEAVSPNIG